MQTESTALIPDDARARAEQIRTKCAEYRATIICPITDNSMAEACGSRLREVATARREIEDARKKAKQPYIDGGKAVDKYFAEIDTALSSVENLQKRELAVYRQKLADEEARRQREAQVRAEEERRKKEEAARKELEKAEMYRQQGREDMAQKAEVRAEQKQEAAETVVAAPVEVAKPDLGGISVRKVWKAEVTDPVKFVAYCVANSKPEFLQPNEKALGAFAKAMQQHIEYPGARVYCVETDVVRSL